MQGIYELKGDELKICLSEPGGQRPGELSAKEGSKRMLITFKKAK